MWTQAPNDPSVQDDEALWRRVHPLQIVPDDKGNPRPSSAAFRDRQSGEVSVHISSLTDSGTVLERYPYHSLAEIRARLPRSLGYTVVRDPIQNDSELPDDPSHALLCPSPSKTGNQRKRDERRMAEDSRWVVLNQSA